MNGHLQRVELLIRQQRYKEAKSFLEDYLEMNPDDFVGQVYMVTVYLNLDEKKSARDLSEKLLERYPDMPVTLALSINVDLNDDLFVKAESKAEIYISQYPEDAEPYILMTKAKLGQRNYSKAYEYVNLALEQDPEEMEALNLRIMIGGFLKEGDVGSDIEDALHLSPENPSTIANQGLQLIREGKNKEALERLEYALSLDPSNAMARYAMGEALKSKFWPYRLFFKYKEAMAKLTEKGSWTFVIGGYIIYRALSTLAKKNEGLRPFITPILILLGVLFLLTWIADPLINLYLLANRYGRSLLDKDDKTMAQLTGLTLTAALIFVGAYFVTNSTYFLIIAAVFAALMIPFGTFLSPSTEKGRKKMTYLTIAIATCGLLGAVLNIEYLLMLGAFGLFGYQWIINAILIQENSRVS